MKPVEAIPMHDDGARTCGVGRLTADRGGEAVVFPLASVRIAARVAGRVARVVTTQTFRNVFAEVLEAVYIFPLSGGCAVTDFELKVGKRVVKGAVKERGAARAEYQKAKTDGKRAALMEQERDDVFTVSVGNIPPGEDVTVVIESAERLPHFDDGMTELRLPVVVAPRYIPGTPLDGEPVGGGIESDTDSVPDASRITPPRLAEGFDPKVGLGIEVDIDNGGEELRDVDCTQHATRTSLGADRLSVKLASDHEPLDRDFVLRWRVATGSVRASCLAWKDARGGSFGMVTVVPPGRGEFPGLPRDVVFVVDRSGSMGGVKMASATRSCSILLNTLGPRDRFAIMAFDDSTDWMVPYNGGSQFVAADEAGRLHGDAFLRGIDARGGTELDGALQSALSAVVQRRQTDGRTPILVILTDGEVGNEGPLLARLQKSLGDARVFTVGIDTAVNSGLLRRLASTGGGTCALVEPGAGLEEALRAVAREIGDPLVSDLKISGEIEKSSQAPSATPDLFAGRASTVFVRLTGGRPVEVKGKNADGSAFTQTVPVRWVDQPAIAALWARTRISDLEDEWRKQPELATDVRAQIIALSVAHQVLTRFTAWVAVDHAEIVTGTGQGRTMVQPVEMPAKWAKIAARSFPMPSPAACSLPASPADMIPETDCAMAPEMEIGPPPMEKAASRPTSKSAQSGVSRPGAIRLGGKVPPPPPPPSPPMKNRASETVASGGPPPKPSQDLVRFVNDLGTALKAARTDLAAGRVPDVKGVAVAREALMLALATDPGASEVPLLQRFLRTSLVAFLEACRKSSAASPALVQLEEKLFREFGEALVEVEKAVGEGGNGSRPFWERTI